MSVGERMKLRRKELKITADVVAAKLGVSRSTVFRYEKGEIEKLPTNILEDVASVLKTTPAYLMGWTTEKEIPVVNGITEIKTNNLNTNTIFIPILGEIACGEPILAEVNINGYKEKVVSDTQSGNLFYLIAKGDSMEPKIPDGSLVLIKEQPDVENGEIAAVLVNGDNETTLKKIRKLGDSVVLEPLNREYPPYVISESNPARIIGKAIEVTAQL